MALYLGKDLISGGGSGGSAKAIIDVDTLPIENINANAFYRVKTGTTGHYMLTDEGINVMDGQPVEVITVETLPATGKPLLVIDYEAGTATATLYVRTSDSTVHFYVDETVSTMLEVPVGWYDASMMNLPYEIVSSPEEASGEAIAFVETAVYKYPLYVYAVDEWVEVKSDYSDFSALGGGGSCNCVIPTKVSELENDAGYVTAYAFDGTYNATTNKAATVSTVSNAISSFEYGSEGLKYIVYDNYAMCTKGECIETDVVIAETALGVPVTSILLAFENDDDIESVVIPKYVTTVNSAFKNCDNLESVVFDDESQLKTIGLNAFNSCGNLKNITLPDSVTEIDQTAFNNCFYLPKINIPNGVTSIGQEAFRGCRHLTSIELPDSVTTIGNKAFDTCERLESITLSNGIVTIEDSTFSGCKALKNITIPNGVTSIGKEAFRSCIKLASITIPDSVTYIGEYAFGGCRLLTSIVLPNGITSLEKDLFTSCMSLSSVTIPNSVTSIGDYAFCLCQSLPSITIPNSVRSIGKQAFSGCNKLTSITVPEGVTSIAQEAFGGLAELTSITLPRSVTTIGANLVMYSEKFTDVYYAGTEEEWAAIAIDADNADLANATIHYNSEV